MANNVGMLSLSESSRLLRLSDVVSLTGYSKSTLYRKIGKDEFPQQVQIGDRAVAWIESEVFEWIDSKIEKREMIGGRKNGIQ